MLDARRRREHTLSDQFDVVVVGAGIVGLATARALVRTRPGLRVAVIEKEHGPALHQTGRNSGVLHTGIYYRPGSLKARMAVSGRVAMERYCAERGVPFERCGKVVVAVDDRDLERLPRLEQRARENGVRVERIGPARLRELEPHATGVGALHVPDTGIVDFAEACRALCSDLEAAGVSLGFGRSVHRIDERAECVAIETSAGTMLAANAVNCAGLFADVLAREALGPDPDVRIVPFRGEYHDLVRSRRHLVRNLVYPVPHPDLPFLGVHLSRGIHGNVHAGPNAVLALAREGYTWRLVDGGEMRALLRYPGFRRLILRFWRVGVVEVYRSLSRRALARALRRLVPEIEAADLVPAAAGVRAQALGRDGKLLDDFVLRETPRVVHVLNAPSPAATAALVIGEAIAARLETREN